MRARVTVANRSGRLLPFDYQYALASALYRRLAAADPDLAAKLHSRPGFRHYCFSHFLGDGIRTAERGLRFEQAVFHISSPDPEFLRPFVEGLLSHPEMEVARVKLAVESVEIVSQPTLRRLERLRTLSPILVKTARESGGQLVEWELYPSDGKFYDNLHRNLVERFEDFHGRPPTEDVFEIREVHWTKPKRMTIAGTPRRCTMMDFTLEASEELMQFGYDAGFGEKQAMGFGCVGVRE